MNNSTNHQVRLDDSSKIVNDSKTININNKLVDHPLSSIELNNRDLNKDMEEKLMEINLETEENIKEADSKIPFTSILPNVSETEPNEKKLNWVQFDEDNLSVLNTDGNSTKVEKITSIPSSLKAPVQQNFNTETKSLHQTMVNQNNPNVPTSSGVAVLKTESTHVNIDRKNTSVVSPVIKNGENGSSLILQNNANKKVTIPLATSSPIRTVELSTGRIREGFANGDVIVNLLPTNTKWPWLTPARFRPELVPEELMAQGLTLTVEEYVAAIETLINDYRFSLYNVCYKRVLVCWISFAFFVLLMLLFSGLQGIALFSLGVAWLFLNAAAIFVCMWMKLRLSRGLEKCLARVNKQLLRHKILLVLDDRGRISCHKVNLCFMYFDPAQCIAYLNEFIERQEQLGNTIQEGWERKLDLDVNDIVIQGSNPVRLSRKQAIAQEVFLTYLQRWGKDYLRRRLDWTCNEAGLREQPRHLMSSICPCQYEEEILHSKIKLGQDKARCCCGLHNPFKHL